MNIRHIRAMRGTPALICMLLLPGWLCGQEPVKPFRYDWNGHVAFVIGTCLHGYTLAGFGGGAEVFVWRGLAVGGDLGVQRFVAHDPFFGLYTAKVGYHFVDRGKIAGIDPFVNMLLGGASASGVTASTGGFNGGLNYWFGERMGLHTEARFQVIGYEEGLLAFRIGLAFR